MTDNTVQLMNRGFTGHVGHTVTSRKLGTKFLSRSSSCRFYRRGLWRLKHSSTKNALTGELVIEIISATRLSQGDFWEKSPLGISLRRLAQDQRLIANITFANRRGLPDIYNSHIVRRGSADILVFMHDDVWIDDYFISDRLIEGLQRYDVIGVAGNKRRVPGQPSWAFLDAQLNWDDKSNLSGAVAHGRHPFGPIALFGPTPTNCELLDGVFLAAKKESLVLNEVKFDSRFSFNFYDMDFCRTARQRGLQLGTWPICLTHQSGGAFGTQNWKESYQAYVEKWGIE